jgi:hypothetical protein
MLEFVTDDGDQICIVAKEVVAVQPIPDGAELTAVSLTAGASVLARGGASAVRHKIGVALQTSRPCL